MKEFITKNFLLGSVFAVAIAFFAVVFFQANPAFSAQTDSRTTEEQQYKTFEFFSATTTSATSTNADSKGMDIKGAEAVTFYFSRAYGGGNSGSSKFRVEVSPDEGTTWYAFNKLVSNVSNTSSQEETRVSSTTISAATTTVMVAMDIEKDAFSRVRCIVIETTDGTHTCKASIEF